MLSKMYPVLFELSWQSMVLRLVLAIVCGGIVGMDRNRAGRPAGFRTHILVCLGAALVMVTNQYIIEMFGGSDPARLGAQVISGIGFLGAGSIIVTGRYQVTGLTTAAGLWASACVGLAIGIGLYEAAVLTCLLILVTERLLHAPGSKRRNNKPYVDLYLEMKNESDISTVILKLQESHVSIDEISRGSELAKDECIPSAHFRVVLSSGMKTNNILDVLMQMDSVLVVRVEDT